MVFVSADCADLSSVRGGHLGGTDTELAGRDGGEMWACHDYGQTQEMCHVGPAIHQPAATTTGLPLTPGIYPVESPACVHLSPLLASTTYIYISKQNVKLSVLQFHHSVVYAGYRFVMADKIILNNKCAIKNHVNPLHVYVCV